MAATADQIATLRRWTAEPSTTTYSDVVLMDVIERYPIADGYANEPLAEDYTVNPPAFLVNPLWSPVYDLHAAAAEIWSEKAATYAEEFDVQFGTKRFSRNQKYANALQQARYHTARRSVRTMALVPSRRVPDVANYVLNLPEVDE